MNNLREQAKRTTEIQRLLELIKPYTSYTSSQETLTKEGYRSMGIGGKWSNGQYELEINFMSDTDTVEIE